MPASTGSRSTANWANILTLLAAIESGTYGLSALQVIVAVIQTATDKLAGSSLAGLATGNHDWFDGVATSGAVGADLCTIGADATRNKISFEIRMNNVTAAAIFTVRMYQKVNGVLSANPFYNESFVKGVDTEILPICTGMYIHDAVRVECQSSAAGDNDIDISYDGVKEAM